MTYRAALAALEARQEARIELGLDKVRRVLRRMGDPHRALRCLHVAGTNGKGSVCVMAEAVLRAGGHKTGLYISPHLADVRERIQINGKAVSKEDFARWLTAALKADVEGKLTYFELLTAAAFAVFADQACDTVVLETGLGGRLDATNVVERPLACVITSIGYDHMAFLGNTLAKIAAEKAGIIKGGVPVVVAKLPSPALRVVRDKARELQAPLTVVSEGWRCERVDWRRARQRLERPDGVRFELSLLGERQGANAALVYEALKGCSISDAAFRRGLARLKHPCRFQVRRLGDKTAIIDGAHNAEAAEHLARTWKASPWARRPARWIVGVLKDKDARAVLAPLRPYMADVVAVDPPSPRALRAAELARLVRRSRTASSVSVEPDAETALRRWRREASAPRTAVVCGSFYLAAKAAEVLGGD